MTRECARHIRAARKPAWLCRGSRRCGRSQGIEEAWRLMIRTLGFPLREMGATAGFRAELHHLN